MQQWIEAYLNMTCQWLIQASDRGCRMSRTIVDLLLSPLGPDLLLLDDVRESLLQMIECNHTAETLDLMNVHSRDMPCEYAVQYHQRLRNHHANLYTPPFLSTSSDLWFYM